jgi:hypothetical protein
MTDRMDMIDEALLRPGGLELKLQIGVRRWSIFFNIFFAQAFVLFGLLLVAAAGRGRTQANLYDPHQKEARQQHSGQCRHCRAGRAQQEL